MLRTREQYHDNLFAMRLNIYIGGEAVGRDDPRLRPGIHVLDVTFDLAQDPEWKGIATAVSDLKIKSTSPGIWLALTDLGTTHR